MRILFSPIGGTDPISNYHDGAMLHICRKYLPDKVYLYLSGEMCEIHDRNDPYRYCLQQLGEHTDHPFDCEVIRRDELTEVQVFDSFMEEFRSILKDIENNAEDVQILVNVSSGTPAMKSSLLMLSVLSEGKYLPIQVSTPEKKMNPRGEDWHELDVDGLWELNEDNHPDYTDRTTIASSVNWTAGIRKEVIQKHIRAYDYVAALQVADSITDFDPVCKELIHAAVCRLRLDFKGMGNLISTSEYSPVYIPVKESNYRIMTEYALSLDIRLKKQEYGDFLRALSPILADLYKLVLREDCGIDVDKQYAVRNKWGSLEWSEQQLKSRPDLCEVFDSAYDRYPFRYDGRVENAHLALLISKLSPNGFSKDRIERLRETESKLRNVAAHQMVSVTKETIKNKVNHWPEEIMKMIQEVLDRYVVKNRGSVWDSYDRMNELIIHKLNA